MNYTAPNAPGQDRHLEPSCHMEHSTYSRKNHTASDDDAFFDSLLVSTCCGAFALGEVVDGLGICSDMWCHENAEFVSQDELERTSK